MRLKRNRKYLVAVMQPFPMMPDLWTRDEKTTVSSADQHKHSELIQSVIVHPHLLRGWAWCEQVVTDAVQHRPLWPGWSWSGLWGGSNPPGLHPQNQNNHNLNLTTEEEAKPSETCSHAFNPPWLPIHIYRKTVFAFTKLMTLFCLLKISLTSIQSISEDYRIHI